MAVWSALSMLPDADVIGFSLGIPYDSPFGHRGATHSFVFAAAIALLALLMARISPGRFARSARATAVAVALVVATHPLLDMLTNGGRGCALLWPFATRRS